MKQSAIEEIIDGLVALALTEEENWMRDNLIRLIELARKVYAEQQSASRVIAEYVDVLDRHGLL